MVYQMDDIKRNSLYDRVNKLLVSFEWSDCSFSVSGRKFKAHKLILGISSPVFEAMFYGPLSSSDNITITDIEPEIFQLMLNYIYTDKVEISSIEESFDLLYVSRKYLLEHLTELCISFIQSNMTVDNVITILNYPDYMQDNKLVSTSLTLLCEHANYVLQENLKNISIQCMKRILQCENMNINEKCLIKYVFEWAIYQCKQINEDVDFEKRRCILIINELFRLLRFSVLSLDDLNEILTDKNNLLLPSEADYIRNDIVGLNDSKELTSINHFASIAVQRNPIKLKWKLCHRSPLRSMSPATIDAHNNSIQTRVKVNKSVFINSLSVPSRMALEVNFYNKSNVTNLYCEQFTVSIESEFENSINNFIILKNIEYDSTLDVEFIQPIFLKKDQWYIINFVWPTQSTYYSYSYAIQSRERKYNNGNIEFLFEDLCSTIDNGGSFLKSIKFCM